jgi:two-component system sensor histidine kinase/response regulator
MTKENTKILIVDDVERNIQVLGSLLRKEGYDIGFAMNGDDALQVLEKQDYDLILLDVTMPGKNGFEVCRIIRQHERLKEIPVIFLTARTENEDVLEGFESGGQDYVMKPFKSSELLARVETHLTLLQQKRELNSFNQKLEHKVDERTKQLNKANQKLEKIEQAKTNFLGIISHELRTPLNGIFGFAEILKEQAEDEENKEFVENIIKSANRLLKFSEAAMLITQLSTDRYPVEQKPSDISALFETVISEVTEQHSDKPKELKKDIQPGVMVSVDSDLIEQALRIATVNAIKYSPADSPVYLELTEAEGEIHIRIQDTGEGFPKSVLENKFEFFNTRDVMNHQKGHGLGLSTMKLIAEVHNSKVDITNNEKGGLVEFIIPLEKKVE